MNFKRIWVDLEYIFLNVFVNKIPSWAIRAFIYKSFVMRIGEGARIGIGTIVCCPSKIVLGKRVIVNEYCYLDGRFGIEINHDVGISAYTKIITGTHLPDSIDFKYSGAKVIIRHHAWLCTGATVLLGSIISEKTVIGAESVYKGISEPNDIIIGNPGKVIRKRNCDVEYKLEYECFFR